MARIESFVNLYLKDFFQMATPTPEELDRQLDSFIDKLIDEKDQLPAAELDENFWKVRRLDLFANEFPPVRLSPRISNGIHSS